ncbi:sensor histidine kinase [Lacrimispora sp. 38-1]|uniref:sensor histidine kinase n=1 Tax=Lacrimispora sp. 38-1 TaxID=3125778 RepID=UPI003CF2BADF
MQKKIHRLFNSISTKVILIIFILVLPLNLIAIVQNQRVIDTMIEQNRASAQTLADAFTYDIGSRMVNTQTLLFYFLMENPDCIRMKLQNENNYTYQSSKLKLYYNLKKMEGMTNGGDGYFYFMKKVNDTLIYDKNPKESNQLYQSINNFLSAQLREGVKNGWHIYELNSKKYLFFIVDQKDVMCGGWFNLDSLKMLMEKRLKYTDYLLSFTEKQNKENPDDRIIVSSKIKNIYLEISIERNEIVGRISIYVKILQIMAFLYLALIPVLFMALRSLLLHPLYKINNAHRQIHNGNQDFRIMEKANSVEYMEAYRSFNQMANNLKTLKIDSYEKELAKQKMELRNLQLQIRPHFLLNTFNLIYTLAQRKEITAIQQIIIYLSEYFRYIFRSDKELELFPKELKLVKGYVKMVSINYSGNVKVSYEINPEISFVRVPPLLIHNFIENSVKYGIKQGIMLHISIIGQYKDKKVTFIIKDDGNGMDEATLEKCRRLLHGEYESERSNSSIGLQNSIRRLKYFYGQDSSIEITSIQGEFTSVTIQFPYNLEVEDEPIISE